MGKRRHKVRELKLSKQKEKLHKNKLKKSKKKDRELAQKA